MSIANLNCTNCGEVLDPRRAELGYDYCLKPECQARCLKRVTLAAVGVNKAAEYYAKPEELLPPALPASASREPEDNEAGVGAGEGGPMGAGTAGAGTAGAGTAGAGTAGAGTAGAGAAGVGRAPSPSPARSKPRTPTALERLRQLETRLDEDLQRSYQRFQRGEVTALEMDRERDQLTAGFNRQVMGENIRYRSMLRPRRGGRR